MRTSAPQQLSDCLQTTKRGGKFLSVDRVAVCMGVSERAFTSPRRREDDDVVLAGEVQQHPGALVQHVGI
jgi:hypothetical protein